MDRASPQVAGSREVAGSIRVGAGSREAGAGSNSRVGVGTGSNISSKDVEAAGLATLPMDNGAAEGDLAFKMRRVVALSQRIVPASRRGKQQPYKPLQ